MEPADTDKILALGGAQRMALLRYAVISMTIEPVFLFCAGDYRLRPTHLGALAVYDMFCAPGAPARLAAYECLPPRELTLAASIERLRALRAAAEAPTLDDEDTRPIPPTPSRELFDNIVRGVRADAHGRLGAIAAAYDASLTPEENLPGGRMNGSQRQFVERVWQPLVRPRLVAAGFWQLAAIG